jgi:hypothetical protein
MAANAIHFAVLDLVAEGTPYLDGAVPQLGAHRSRVVIGW